MMTPKKNRTSTPKKPKIFSPLKTVNTIAKTSRDAWKPLPKVKYNSLRQAEKGGSKRSFGITENSGGESSQSSDGFSSSKKIAVNPFPKSKKDLLCSSSDSLDVYSLPDALNCFEPSQLVETLRLQEKSGKAAVNNHVYQEQALFVKKVTKEIVKMPYIPYKDFFDWSIKTKVLVNSKVEVGWLRNLSSEDRVRSHTRCDASAELPKGASFLRLLQYWTFPELSGTKTFPRSHTHTSVHEVSPDWRAVMPAIETNWKVCVTELIDAVEHGACPYFYIATHLWTALVLSKEVSENGSERVYVTPTSLGFRNLLKDSGFCFEMPLKQTGEKPDEVDLNTSDCSDGSTEKTNLRWIKEQCKSIGTIEIDDTKEREAQMFDRRPESLISLEGLDVGRFVRELVQKKILLPSGGPLTNLPPTLIAPVPFVNATMKRLEYTIGRSGQCTNLEVFGGPILPHFIPSLATIFPGGPENNISVGFSTCEATVALVCVSVPQEQEHHEVQPDLQGFNLADIASLHKTADSAKAASHISSDVIRTMQSFHLI